MFANLEQVEDEKDDEDDALKTVYDRQSGGEERRAEDAYQVVLVRVRGRLQRGEGIDEAHRGLGSCPAKAFASSQDKADHQGADGMTSLETMSVSYWFASSNMGRV